MLNVAIYGAGNWGARLIASVQGKNNKTKFTSGIKPRGIHTIDAMINWDGVINEVYAHSERRKLQPPIDMDDTTSMPLRF